MLPKKGRMLHPWNGLARSAKDYAELIADALRQENGDTHRAVKTIMGWTGASERSVKNWLSGEFGPSGYFLMRLCGKSGAIRELIVDHLVETDISPSQNIRRLAGTNKGKPMGRKNARNSYEGRSPVEVDGVTQRDKDVTNGDISGHRLNRRQEWLLTRVESGASGTVDDISTHWRVSKRTAKRDIAALRTLGLIAYSPGHYGRTDKA
ncbi:DeoR family transcriptional regulator [Sphingopyxis sp. LK2115]|uniref:DeoR family transcriptional regulator n=1 Tax=Sphingopyxis sp. LK2115 TaxID=2744558 RepID=UPI0016602799|nr:DeoR family transcriptional regulator [Sphingopyxis sp. LK2115]